VACSIAFSAVRVGFSCSRLLPHPHPPTLPHGTVPSDPGRTRDAHVSGGV